MSKEEAVYDAMNDDSVVLSGTKFGFQQIPLRAQEERKLSARIRGMRSGDVVLNGYSWRRCCGVRSIAYTRLSEPNIGFKATKLYTVSVCRECGDVRV